MDTYVYQLGDALYVNLTNQCTNQCGFCIRNGCQGVGGYKLWLDKEPSAKDVLKEIGDPTKYSEVVFCGFGEPMIKLDELIQIAREIKAKGGKVRINTNGQANLYHGRDVVPQLKGLVDTISISLNAATAQDYQKMCQPLYGEDAYRAVLDFTRRCVGVIPRVVLSVVDVIPPEEIEECKKIAEETGVEFRVRHMV